MGASEKPLNILIEYIHDGHLRAALALREQGEQVVVVEANGAERRIARDLVLVRHPERHASRDHLKEALAGLNEERERLRSELDLNLLWEIVHEDRQGYSAAALAETFFGRVGTVETAVMLEALLNDRLYFVRRHIEFVARDPAQVERLRTQYQQIQLRSQSGRQTRQMIMTILEGGPLPPREDFAGLISDLNRYLTNPFARNRETQALLEATSGTLTPAEAAYEILQRLGAKPPGPRFVVIGGIRTNFSEAALREARDLRPPPRPSTEGHPRTVTIDDEETIEIDDAIGCEQLADGSFRVWVHIALVADFVPRGSAMDKEAGARGTTVYLPEASVRMLPDPVSTDAASLKAGQPRPVMTTVAELSPNAELMSYSIYPEQLAVTERLSYDRADQILAAPLNGDDANHKLLTTMALLATKLRERRRRAGAYLVQRREPKVVVSDDDTITISIIDGSSPSRELVAELMVLSNYIAARSAADRGIPMIFRVQPNFGDDVFMQRPRLSLHPEFHAGVGLDCYVQASSPIRRYVDLVLQRQLVAMLSEAPQSAYQREELLTVLAAAETIESEGRELERRARRYWILTYLQQHADQPFIAMPMRDGGSAELEEYGVRGSLHGVPSLPSNTRIVVKVARVDPLHGVLGLSFERTLSSSEESVG